MNPNDAKKDLENENGQKDKAKKTNAKKIEVLRENIIFNRKIYAKGTDVAELPDALVAFAKKAKKIEKKTAK